MARAPWWQPFWSSKPEGWVEARKPWNMPARIKAKYSKPKAEGEGERLPDFVHVTGHESFRLDVPKPGAYVKCVGPPGEHVWDVTTDVCSRCGMTRKEHGASTPFPAPAIAAGYPMEKISDGAPPNDGCVPVSWWACDPLGHWIGLTYLGHVVREHHDGTVTVMSERGGVGLGTAGLIVNDGPYEPVWRGTLVRGIWEAEGA